MVKKICIPTLPSLWGFNGWAAVTRLLLLFAHVCPEVRQCATQTLRGHRLSRRYYIWSTVTLLIFFIFIFFPLMVLWKENTCSCRHSPRPAILLSSSLVIVKKLRETVAKSNFLSWTVFYFFYLILWAHTQQHFSSKSCSRESGWLRLMETEAVKAFNLTRNKVEKRFDCMRELLSSRCYFY